ncbi:carbonic anhydrase 12-like [Orbicella faveolata]|uniref:carbonic anhydrase 12-like n=1 Tax=Orbicella faveolata TaxID=48498 RepID=UPI0009E4C76C|nr:carbonic anhydrase 12-like [Orbicella faveolata]
MDALNHEDGLAVLGLFIQVGGKINTAFSFLESARNLTSSYTSISDIPAFRFDRILPANKTKYFRYSGSLTTPSCKESVTWTVFRDAVNISQYQMNLLRQLRKTYTTTSVGNFRPVQPLYDRIIRASFQVAEIINSTSTEINSTVSTNWTGTTTATITDEKATSSISSTVVATTNPEESPPAPTVEFDLESSAVRMTGGLFLSMLFAALFVN